MKNLFDRFVLLLKMVDMIFTAFFKSVNPLSMCVMGMYPIRKCTYEIHKKKETATLFACPVSGDIGYTSKSPKLLESLRRAHMILAEDNNAE